MSSSLLLHQLLLRIMEDNDTLYYYDYEETALNQTQGDIFLNLSLDLEFPGAEHDDSLEEECGPDGKQLVLDTFAQVTTFQATLLMLNICNFCVHSTASSACTV